MSEDLFMRRALELATIGRGNVSPNPMVGCVIVHEGKIIGEGYHQRYGEAHAEVNAINSVKNQSLLPSSTVYVTLEPCSHFGKTPPCADLLIRKRIKKVVIACRDPFDQVDGKGIEKLRAARIEVEIGLLETEAIDINKRFFSYHQKKRPYVILKWAQTADGFIARENFDSKWISNQYARQLVHKWRTEEDAILVGKSTALHDNPSLTARNWSGRNPIRILLDSNLEVPQNHNLFNNEAETLIINKLNSETIEKNSWLKVQQLSPHAILKSLYKRKTQSVIIEGGTQVLNSFIKENCWDEARIFSSAKTFGKGIPAPKLNGRIERNESIQNDRLTIYQNPNG